jgi:hypothetical protein
MPVRPSLAADITRLIEELRADVPHRRELAAARLAVIGSRAVTPLLTVAGNDADGVPSRVAALETLGAIGDARALPVVRSLAGAAGDERLAEAAIDVLGQLAKGTDTRATEAFEQLAALVTQPDVTSGRRLAALSALDGQPASLLAPLYAALSKDPSARVVARVTRRQAGADSLEVMADGQLPSDPAVMLAVVRDDGDRASLSTLKKAVDAVRRVEHQSQDSGVRAGWAAARGALHQQLAGRASRLALYDLRETLEQVSGPLPVGFLSAAAAIGDTTCLTPIAQAWVHAGDDERWWREHLADAFRAIVKREALTRRHPTLRKILERWPAAGVLVASAKR